jgi:hypothetical protein
MGKRGLEPRLAIREQVPSERKREAKLYWTERLIAQATASPTASGDASMLASAKNGRWRKR